MRSEECRCQTKQEKQEEGYHLYRVLGYEVQESGEGLGLKFSYKSSSDISR